MIRGSDCLRERGKDGEEGVHGRGARRGGVKSNCGERGEWALLVLCLNIHV